MKAKRTNLSSAPKAISNPDMFRISFDEYVDETKLNPFIVTDFVGKDGSMVHREKERPLTIEGFENFMCDKYGISTIQQYLENRDGKYKEYISILAYVRRKIRQDQIEGGMAFMYHANLTARIQGISDKLEQTVEQSVKLLNIDPL
jgi:hypothetical protein